VLSTCAIKGSTCGRNGLYMDRLWVDIYTPNYGIGVLLTIVPISILSIAYFAHGSKQTHKGYTLTTKESTELEDRRGGYRQHGM